jgi:hypothetical protein
MRILSVSVELESRISSFREYYTHEITNVNESFINDLLIYYLLMANVIK